MRVAPASAAYDDGGIGTHTSSQISTWKFSMVCSAAWNSSRLPKATLWPSSSILVAPEISVNRFARRKIGPTTGTTATPSRTLTVRGIVPSLSASTTAAQAS